MAASTATRLVIDGSILEGGGQILRNSTSLAALLHKSLTVEKIRNGRKPPGLKNQHRTGLQLVSEISSGTLSRAVNGSTSIDFTPGSDWQQTTLPGTWTADPKTAGSIMLLLQISLPLVLFSPFQPSSSNTISTITLRGGTNASNAPQLDYSTNIFLPFIHAQFNAPRVTVDIQKRGYFPKGGGCVSFSVSEPLPAGTSLSSITLLEQGDVVKIEGISHFAGLPNVVGKDMIDGALHVLENAGFYAIPPEDAGGSILPPDANAIPISISNTRFPPSVAPGAGSGIVLYATLTSGAIIGGSGLGAKGISATRVGEDAAKELIRNLRNGGVVDEWLQDQVILFMALAKGTSQINIGRSGPTLHTQSAIWVAEQLTSARFTSHKNDKKHTIITCEGIGYNSKEDQVEIDIP